MNLQDKNQRGFTLMELMIVIAIVGILAAAAVPQYANYTKRAKFTEVISYTASAKTAVSICYQAEGNFNNCNGAGAATDYGDIPDDIAAPGVGYLESMQTVLGKITAKGNAEVDGHTYELEPAEVNGKLQWAVSGTCYAKNICR